MSFQQGTIKIDNIDYKYSPVLTKNSENVFYSRQLDNNNRGAWGLFRENVTGTHPTSWYSGSWKPPMVLPEWAGFDFGKPVEKIGVALIYDSYGSHKPTDYQIQYYDNGEWKDIVSVVGATPASLISKTILHLFDNPVVAQKFRYHVTKNADSYAAVLHRLRLLDEKEFAEEKEFEIIEKFQTEDGTVIKDTNNFSVPANGNYNSTAPDIIGYENVGYKINNGALQNSNTVSIANVNSNNEIMFVYKKKEIIGNDLVLTGIIVHFAAPFTPDGWLVCDGSEVSKTKYSELYKVVGEIYGESKEKDNFKLPDLRGEFIRGYDFERGIDKGRVFGSEQLDALQDHTHGGVVATVNSKSVSTIPVARVADETRPINVALLPCIKY